MNGELINETYVNWIEFI